MKRLLINWFCFFVSFWVVFGIGYTYGADLELRLTRNNYEDNEIFANAPGLEARLKWDSLFLFASADNAQLRWCGLPGGNLFALGLGFGMQHDFDLAEKIRLTPWIKTGYYHIWADLEGTWTVEKSMTKWETLYRKMEDIVGTTAPYNWDNMNLELNNHAFRFGYGLDASYQIKERLSLLLGINQNYLYTLYEITGYNDDNDYYWTCDAKLNLNSTQIAIALAWEF